jgi:hypothetical protein
MEANCVVRWRPGRGLPPVMITGRNDSAGQRLIEKAHPVAALFKPVDERTLFDAIAEHSLVLMDDLDDRRHVRVVDVLTPSCVRG